MHPASTVSRVDTVPQLKIVALIPARYASTRLPGKALADLDGRPMIEHVYRRASASPVISQVIVATDDLRIATRVSDFGGKVRLTKATHQTGTDRLAEVAASLNCDVVVNIQGDEPLIDPAAIGELVAPFADRSVQITTLYRRIHHNTELTNPNITKVVLDRGGYALYFSRATIPFDRDLTQGAIYYKHLGFYAYRKQALDRFVSWPEATLERIERLEQLRFLENGVPIYVGETPYDTVGVDTEEDVKRVEAVLSGKRM